MSLDGDSPEAEHVLGGNILLPRVVVLVTSVTSAAERGGTRLQTRLDATRQAIATKGAISLTAERAGSATCLHHSTAAPERQRRVPRARPLRAGHQLAPAGCSRMPAAARLSIKAGISVAHVRQQRWRNDADSHLAGPTP